MSVHRKGLQGAGTCIDKSETMLLSRLEFELGNSSVADAWSRVASGFQRAVEVVAAVDERVDSRDCYDIEVRVENGSVDVAVVSVVVVREQKWAEV
jgi:hypothetical protein